VACILLGNKAALAAADSHYVYQKGLPVLMDTPPRPTQSEWIPPEDIPNHHEYLRDIVIGLADYARKRDKHFNIVLLGGEDLLKRSKREVLLDQMQLPLEEVAKGAVKPAGIIRESMVNATDGLILTSSNCGGHFLNKTDRAQFSKRAVRLMFLANCQDEKKQQAVQKQAMVSKLVPLTPAMWRKGRPEVPHTRPINENIDNVRDLRQVKNGMIIGSTDGYDSLDSYLEDLRGSNYDMIVIDAFFHDKAPLQKKIVETLRYKNVGSRRLVFALMNVSLATPNKFYWNTDWRPGDPAWLRPDGLTTVDGVFLTEYWNNTWKEILGQYFVSIMDMGYDGIVLEGLEANWYFDKKTPLK
jgi:endo-alpha-1,4-polygalactosaminidase (GH114 family)